MDFHDISEDNFGYLSKKEFTSFMDGYLGQITEENFEYLKGWFHTTDMWTYLY